MGKDLEKTKYYLNKSRLYIGSVYCELARILLCIIGQRVLEKEWVKPDERDPIEKQMTISTPQYKPFTSNNTLQQPYILGLWGAVRKKIISDTFSTKSF